ncbi:MAG: response regulator transcription factor [Holophagales bacterium]|nr:response regulator transcription factor [Holophagales bacterium]
MSARILLVEDEAHLAEGIAENLEVEGLEVVVARTGRQGLDYLLAQNFQMVILDVMLPELDGFTVCQLAREEGDETPILFLTAKDAVEDRIRGLEAGGDDYLPKPFHLKELLLRVKAILRRKGWQESAGEWVRFGGNEVDLRSYQGRSFDQREHALTQKEALILAALARRPGEVVTREEILDEVWGHEVFPSTRTIDNFILRLRKRFEPDPENPVFFHTVRGVGYRFTPEPSQIP